MLLARGGAVAAMQKAAEAERLGLDLKSDVQVQREQAARESKTKSAEQEKQYYATRSKPTGVLRHYVLFGDRVHELVHSDPFSNAILVVIVIACIMVGAQTYPSIDAAPATQMLESIILWIFVAEILLKVCGETLKPWRFFTNPRKRKWNIFDFIIVVTCLPFFNLGSTG